MSLTDWFYNNFYGGDQLAAQGHALDNQLAQIDTATYGPGSPNYNPKTYATVQNDLLTGSYDYQLAQAQGAENATPGIGSVFKDLFVLGAIGAAFWAFFNFGGTGLLKSLAKKSKWYVVGIVGAAALLLYAIYSEFKKTASDTQSTAAGVASGLAALNPFA